MNRELSVMKKFLKWVREHEGTSVGGGSIKVNAIPKDVLVNKMETIIERLTPLSERGILSCNKCGAIGVDGNPDTCFLKCGRSRKG